MKHLLIACALVVVSAAGSTAVAGRQNHPDFSGRWTPVSGGTEMLVITHKDPSFEAVLDPGGADERMTLTIGGTSRTSVHNGNVEVTSEAAWQGDTLAVTHTFHTVPEGTVTSVRQQTLALDEAGRLVVQTTSTRGGRTLPATRAVYRRPPPPDQPLR